METILEAVSTLDHFTLTTACIAAVLAFGLIREMLDSMALACIAAPVLIVGALAANYLFRANMLVPTPDKDTNVVVASAVGVLIAMVLILISIWAMMLMSERRTRNRRLMQLPDAAADSRD